MNTEITEDVGFYFAIFQRDMSGNLVKCWLDGSEDWMYFTNEEFIQKAHQANYDVSAALSDALQTFSLYIWDVDNGKVERLSAQGHAHGNLQDHLHPMQDFVERSNPFADNLQITKDSITFKF